MGIRESWTVRLSGVALFFLLALLLLPRVVSSQPSISVNTVSAPVNTLTINDLFFLDATTPKWLFTIQLSTQGTVEAIMRISVDVHLAKGDVFANAAILVTKPFIINTTRTITNLDIGRGRPIEDSIYTIDASARSRFEDVALPSGTMPAGTYNFNVEVTARNNSTPGTGDFTIVLSNPSSPLLLAPRDGDEFVNQFPLFQWQFDGPRSRLAVFEKLPGQSSLEETVSGVPHLQVVMTGNSYQYPTAGVRALQPGKSYVWSVTGLATVSGGSEAEFRSPLASFTVASGGATSSYSQLLAELERSLPPQYQRLIEQIKAEGLTPSGTISLNGSTISVADVLRILSQFRSNPGIINSVSIE